MICLAKNYPYLYSLVLVDAKVVHETKDLLAMLSHSLPVELGFW